MTNNGFLRFFFLFMSALVVLQSRGAAEQTRHGSMASLDVHARTLFATAMEWGDRYYDPAVALCEKPAMPADQLADPHSGAVAGQKFFMVRESSWYAAGLLLRDQKGDRERAAKVLNAVLAEQFHAPGKRWDGTFRRTPNEPDPTDQVQLWKGYDPNWRVFIGTTFALILTEYPERIPAELRERMQASIRAALEGEIHEGRLVPSYTNIALMYGFLLGYAAHHGGDPAWLPMADHWQNEIYNLYQQHDAFNEYNSPTYAGVDFYALALWRDYGWNETMRARARAMEDGLWRATAAFYNANLRNISGPYDRSYGMDMQSYVSVDGLWLRMVLDAQKAPLTSFRPPVDHVADLWIVPLLAVLDARIPADAMKSFEAFPGEHAERRAIEGPRVATAWIGRTLVYGGEITGLTRLVDAESQFHPVTAQWLMPDGKIGWLNMTRCPYIDADATQEGIAITTRPAGAVSFRIAASDVKTVDVKAAVWTLPGLTVQVATDGTRFSAEPGKGYVDVSYQNVSKMHLRFVQTK